jgi:hypothetical protein
MRCSNVFGVVGPTFNPNPHSMPRMLISTLMALPCNSLRVVSSARTSWGRQRLAVNREEPAKPHKLGYTASILAIGLHRHRLERVPDVPCLQQFDR